MIYFRPLFPPSPRLSWPCCSNVDQSAPPPVECPRGPASRSPTGPFIVRTQVEHLVRVITSLQSLSLWTRGDQREASPPAPTLAPAPPSRSRIGYKDRFQQKQIKPLLIPSSERVKKPFKCTSAAASTDPRSALFLKKLSIDAVFVERVCVCV